MKTNKSPAKAEVTPSKKILKQARLPFKLISEVTPPPAAPHTRKRKLSVPDAEPVSKLGKISKENDLATDLVEISDDESKDVPAPQKEVKPHNPMVKLVDTAWKKKLQKSKASKKKNKKIRSTKKLGKECVQNGSDTGGDVEHDDIEMVEVEVQIHTEEDDITKSDLKNSNTPRNNKLPENPANTSHQPNNNTNTNTNKSPEQKNVSQTSEIICLDDSNNSSDVKTTVKSTVESGQTVPTLKDVEDVDDNENNKNLGSLKNHELSFLEEEVKDEILPVTPKRSARNKAKTEEKNQLDTSPSSSKLNESVSSDPTTPKRTNRSSSVTNSQGDVSMSESTIVSANLTPKQLQRQLESAKKKEEREKEKQEREKKRQLEKEERARQRQEKEDLKKREREEKEEAKRKDKEEKEEQRRQEKEEKDKQKEMEKKMREAKEEMKRKEKEDKEEQRKKEKEAREEEKRKKQEALELEKQEQEQKKKKAAEAFVNFFVPKQKEEKDQTIETVSKNSVLSSFSIKVDMRLAPTIRVDLGEEKREALDKLLDEQNVKELLYLKCLREGHKPLSSGKTWKLSDKNDDDDVMIVEDELPPIDGTEEIMACEQAAREKLRPKLLSFHENRRPPYWGTWRKKSASVKPRKPFAQDQKQLDYEVDSDEEWEEEQEGESLDGSACGSDDEDARGDDYEVDNELFVPHGYLSDEEATMDEDEGDVLSLTPETQKARLKHLEDEFESEMKKPTEKLKPRLYGLLWETCEGKKPDNCVDALWNYFAKFAMVLNDPTPLLQPANEPDDADKKRVKKKKTVAAGEEPSPKSDKKKKTRSENKESKKPKTDTKKNVPNQPGINSFLTKIKST